MVAMTPKVSGLFLGSERAISLSTEQSPSEKKAAWQTLLEFENQQLPKLAKHQTEKVQQAIDRLIGKQDNAVLVPRLLTTISDSKGQKRYALIVESPLLMIPGNSGLSVHIFAQDGSLIRSSAFQTGWRIFVKDVRIGYLPQINREALEVRSAPAINGRDVARQLYALINDDVLLIRLEDKAGHLIRNVYGAPNHTFGFTMTGRSTNEWKAALESGDFAEVLATLTWLSGTHSDPTEAVPEVSGMPPVAYEDISEARVAREVQRNEDVGRHLKTLLLSQNLWVRQAAKLADNPESFSWGIKIK
jgi:hypothetical protein